jgi:DinB superfamily
MDLVILREEYALARRYTQSLYEDLSESEAQWRPAPRSSSIAWHLGHQAMVTHLLLRNLIAGEPSLYPHFDLLFDAACPQEQRVDLPPVAAIITYRDAVAARTHEHLRTVLEDRRAVAHDAARQVARIMVPIVVSLINHEYQHDCWIREMRALLNRNMPDCVFSRRVSQQDGYWGLQS